MAKHHKIRLAILVFLFLAASVSLYAAVREERKGVLTVAFLNVGQGDAIYIESPNGNQMLIDGGPGKSVLRELSKVMPFYDRTIDAVLLTHADEDHAGGLPDVLGKYKVGLFLEPGVPGESSAYEQLEAQVDPAFAKATAGEEVKIIKMEARRGMEIDLGGGAVLEILFPDRDPSGMDTNAASVVARLVYGENEFLLTGDSPQAIEGYLVSLSGAYQGSLILQSDVLKAGHHGSKTSTGPEFISAVSPQYAVISVGKDNRYGHPNREVLDVINDIGAQILRTDELGRIIFRSDGVNLKIK